MVFSILQVPAGSTLRALINYEINQQAILIIDESKSKFPDFIFLVGFYSPKYLSVVNKTGFFSTIFW